MTSFARDASLPSLRTSVSVVSYNVLANRYAISPIVPDLYKHAAERGALEWKFRLPLLRQELERYNADIFCLQECDLAEFNNDFGAYFAERGYDSFLQDDKGRRETQSTGNATFWRRSKFSLVWDESRTRSLCVALRWNELVSKDATAAAAPPVEETTPAPAPAPAAAAEEEAKAKGKAAGKKGKQPKGGKEVSTARPTDGPYLYVANVHLEGDPNLADRRFEQLRSAIKHMRSHLVKQNFKPAESQIIVAGDFNCSLASGCYRLMTTGELPAGFTEPRAEDTLKDVAKDKKESGEAKEEKKESVPLVVTKSAYSHKADFQFDSAYAASGVGEPGLTFALPQCFDVLDFIFYTRPTLRCRGVLAPLSKEEEEDIKFRTFLPSPRFPSDHIAVGAVLDLVTVPAATTPALPAEASAPAGKEA